EIAVASKEFGEAMAAAIRITQSNASPLDVHRALAEVEQSAGAIDALMRRLTSFLPSMATDAGKDGGKHQ
ncbi:hypothetical protein ABTK48_20080, partial [Acinetobacter baumannii]